MSKLFILVLASVVILLGCSCQSNMKRLPLSADLVPRAYEVSPDFHYDLAKLVKVNPNKHRGVKSLLELAGIKFPPDSIIAFNTVEVRVYFYNTEEEQLKIRRLIEGLYGESP